MDLVTNICVGVGGIFALGAITCALMGRYRVIKESHLIKEELANTYTPDVFHPASPTEEITEDKEGTKEGDET